MLSSVWMTHEALDFTSYDDTLDNENTTDVVTLDDKVWTTHELYCNKDTNELLFTIDGGSTCAVVEDAGCEDLGLIECLRYPDVVLFAQADLSDARAEGLIAC